MSFETWIAFVAASTALLLIPGPTVMLVIAYAIAQGRRVALAVALGVAAGDLAAMSASLLGLGALLSASATLFTVFKWIGACYLIWLGWRLLRSKPAPPDAADAPAAAPRRMMAHAFAVTALNPKSIAFFVAFVPQFIRPDAPFAGQAAILIATFVILAGINAAAYALLADRARVRIRRPSALVWLNRIGGGALVAMGAATMLLRRA